MPQSIDLTMRRGIEFLSIVLDNDTEVIYYAKKYIKQGWVVYSIDKGAKFTLSYEFK
jgi:hypothetical protein